MARIQCPLEDLHNFAYINVSDSGASVDKIHISLTGVKDSSVGDGAGLVTLRTGV